MKTSVIRFFILMGAISVCCFLFPSNASAQSIAPAYKVADCDGAPLDLYKDLSEGKVIVIGWAMPCATCVSPLLSVHNAVLNFALSNPGRVSLWIVDDYANTNCETLKSWCKNNGIVYTKYIVSKDVKMTDFGSNGMPKVVVIGCTSGKVYYNVNNTPEGNGVTTAIKNALKDIETDCFTSESNVNQQDEFYFYPNPTNGIVKIRQANSIQSIESILVTDLTGRTIHGNIHLNLDGEDSIDLRDLPAGPYIVQIMADGKTFRKTLIKGMP